ncbi:hypothetical protein [Phenylobacterium sp.]
MAYADLQIRSRSRRKAQRQPVSFNWGLLAAIGASAATWAAIVSVGRAVF